MDFCKCDINTYKIITNIFLNFMSYRCNQLYNPTNIKSNKYLESPIYCEVNFCGPESTRTLDNELPYYPVSRGLFSH